MSDISVSDSSSISDEEECEVENFDATSLTMVQVISECKDDAIIKSSTKGPAILELLDCLLEGCIESKELEKLKEIMIQCVLGRKNKISEIWRNFHVARLSPAITSAWQFCLTSLQDNLPPKTSDISDITLQVVLKRLMHAVVKQLTRAPSASNKCTPQGLTDREENAIRYMAGYVIVKLRKKYRKHSLYARALETMKTSLDETDIESLQDYTCIWVEQRDREDFILSVVSSFHFSKGSR